MIRGKKTASLIKAEECSAHYGQAATTLGRGLAASLV